MATQSTLNDPGRDTNTFYRRTLHVLSDAHVPFLVGGSHAYLEYTGIVRNTKDFDLFIRRDDLETALESLRESGYRAEISFPHWLAKAHQADCGNALPTTYMPFARDVYEEGSLVFPAVRIQRSTGSVIATPRAQKWIRKRSSVVASSSPSHRSTRIGGRKRCAVA